MQNLYTQVSGLLKAELTSDFRRPAVLAAAGLQVLAVSFLCYLGNPNINPKVWNSLFWISLVFGVLQATGKAFLHVSKNRWIYTNQLASPLGIILAKTLYSWVISITLGLSNLLVFTLLMDFPAQHNVVYIAASTLSVMGFSTVFTLITAIAGKTPQPGFIAPVLGLPVILPFVLVGMQASLKALNPVLVSSVYIDLMLLAALNFLVLVLTALLFTPLWRD
jgi:heme exporter protein B